MRVLLRTREDGHEYGDEGRMHLDLSLDGRGGGDPIEGRDKDRLL